jgi:RimJ/RimL family protein N-acetyltransferase
MITDQIILLRPFKPGDVAQVCDAVRESVPVITQWMADLHEGLTEQDVRDWILATPRLWSDGVIYHFAITTVADGRFLGGGSVNHVDRHHRFANLTYWVRDRERGRGVAPSAVRLMARFAFEKLGCNGWRS